MKRTATIIINRNLPEVTDKLYESLLKNNEDTTDIFIVESGSDEEKLSKYCTWWANWPESMKRGLRTPRGFNYGLERLWTEGRFKDYDFFFIMPNDIEFADEPVISILQDVMDRHDRVGILSPCSANWGEHRILGENHTKYFWYINAGPWFLRRAYVEDVMNVDEPDYMNFLFDGTNYRGYETEIELIVKGYANDWASAITTRVMAEENETHLKTKAELIKTDMYEENLAKYIEEGKKWLRRKYGFNNRWMMQMYAKFFYEKFFEHYPELRKYSL